MKASRFFEQIDALDVAFVVGLGSLGVGTWLAYDLGNALMVLGGILAGIGIVAVLRKGA